MAALLDVLVSPYRSHLVDTIVLSRDELLPRRADAADQPERRPVLAGPVRAVRAVHHEGHALAHGRRGVGGEEVGRDPRHVDVTVGGNPCVVHAGDDTPVRCALTWLAASGNVPTTRRRIRR